MLSIVSKTPPPLPPAGETPESRESALLARCRAGDARAFEALYGEHRRIVAATLYKVLGDRGELDDLIQEVFLIAFRGLERFRGDSKVSTWLYRICINVALGRLRHHGRRPAPVTLEPVHERTLDDGRDGPERLMERGEDVARVRRALEALPPKKRVVLVMHEIDGLELKEIAGILGVPQVTARTRLHYAKKEFYAILAGEQGNPAGEGDHD
jgi:RNA polymerase sigma-70 factor (ECF subfamily)